MVEATAAENNKGAAVARVLEQIENYELALCAGDDLTDESMFELSRPGLLTLKVGLGATQARFQDIRSCHFPTISRRLVHQIAQSQKGKRAFEQKEAKVTKGLGEMWLRHGFPPRLNFGRDALRTSQKAKEHLHRRKQR